MKDYRVRSLSRRRLLRAGGLGLTGAGAALLFGCGDDDGAAEDFDDPPETTSLRIAKPPPACQAAQYVAEQFLLEDGFSSVEYVPVGLQEIASSAADGKVDFCMEFAPYLVSAIDSGRPLTVLAGIHVGCWEVFAADPEIRTVSDLKGRTIGEYPGPEPNTPDTLFMTAFLGNVGIDIRRDVEIKVVASPAEAAELLLDGEIDAFRAQPPATQDLRARGIGHVILNGIEDAPYSGYFCCMLSGNAEFVEAHPAATRRVVRAYIRAAEHCARDPEAVADFLVARGHMTNRDYAGEMMRALPYDVWRRYNPEDTLRFYALRLREAEVISGSPDDIISRGTDWTTLNQLKKEMAAFPAPQPSRASAFNCDIPGNPPLALRSTESSRDRRRLI